MGLKYGCLVEDVITGLAIQCRGWRSIYFNPERKGFLGVAPTTLLQSLIQHKRWSEGDFQIFASSHCPFLIGYKKIPLKLQITYCVYLLWAPSCLATLYYVTVPSLCLLRGISLFPEVRDFKFLKSKLSMIVVKLYSKNIIFNHLALIITTDCKLMDPTICICHHTPSCIQPWRICLVWRHIPRLVE
jgi:cellulose synthase/poly-beta-1,6-N-acetylglucosamine synthase-like glycosyltransferase